MKSNAIVIGSGFAGLSAATHLAHKGVDVTVIEKNDQAGGRARTWESGGFTFDMGPSWYWMPDVFEDYFGQFGKKPADYYDLIRLDPSYRIFTESETIDIPASYEELREVFENREKGSAQQLDRFLQEAEVKYNVGMNDLVRKPANSIFEFAHPNIIASGLKLHLFRSFRSHIQGFFKDPVLQTLMEFPVLFLGAKPEKTPALYSLMNYADIKLGTWYPKGGMHKVVQGMRQMAEEIGVSFRFNEPVSQIYTSGSKVLGISTKHGTFDADAIIGSADYHHVESLLDRPSLKNYKEAYWSKRTMAPSCLLFFVGLDKKVDGLEHHNLFFDASFDQHAKTIYDTKEWPDNPLFYVCAPSKTDDTVAPEGCENLFILIPLAPGLEDSTIMRRKYFDIVLERIEQKTGCSVRDSVSVYRDFAMSNFEGDYNAYRGNAYGLANTLRQTAFLKPKMRNKKLNNLWYTGQLTTPGPGVPPSLISGGVAATEALKILNHG